VLEYRPRLIDKRMAEAAMQFHDPRCVRMRSTIAICMKHNIPVSATEMLSSIDNNPDLIWAICQWEEP
jgi:hypothetical protein